MKPAWIKLIIIGSAAVVGYVSFLILGSPDGPVEQAAESVLRTQGIDVDLSAVDRDK